MKKIFYNLLLFINLVVLSFMLSSCFTTHTFLFQEGNYIYEGESLPFYEDISLTYLDLNFKLTDKNDNEDNVIKNNRSKDYYFVTFIMKTDNDEEFNISFKSQKEANEKDRYRIIVDLSEIINVKDAKFDMALHITNKNYYYEKQSQENSIADEIELSILISSGDNNVIRQNFITDFFILKFAEK